MNRVNYPNFKEQAISVLKDKLASSSITQKELAKRLKLSQPQISKVLSGSQKDYKLLTIQKIFNAIGYHPVFNVTKIKEEQELENKLNFLRQKLKFASSLQKKIAIKEKIKEITDNLN